MKIEIWSFWRRRRRWNSREIVVKTSCDGNKKTKQLYNFKIINCVLYSVPAVDNEKVGSVLLIREEGKKLFLHA
jgi:hypothetical protein